MIVKFVKIVLLLASFALTTGFIPFATLLGPGLTVVSSGNIYKASAQLLVDLHVKNKTGKSSFAYVKEEVSKQNDKKNLNEDFKNLIEARVKITHEKIIQQNKKNNLDKGLRQLIKKRIKIVRKKLDTKKLINNF
jgi:hypothetical protein